jgi:hypothetical protein
VKSCASLTTAENKQKTKENKIKSKLYYWHQAPLAFFPSFCKSIFFLDDPRHNTIPGEGGINSHSP